MKAKNLTCLLAIVLPALIAVGCQVSPSPPPTTNYALTVQASPSNGGTVTRAPDQALYASGTAVTVTAAPAAGFAFDHWEGSAGGAVNPTTVTMNANKTVTAVFVSTARYTLTVTSSPSDGGDVSRAPDQAEYTPGTAVTLTAAPAVGYAFDHWEGDAAGTVNPTTVTMDANRTVTAVFVSTARYTLAVTSSPSDGGDVSRSPDQAEYAPGTVVTLTATPAAGNAFSRWEGDASGTDNPTTVTMDADKTVTAFFTGPAYAIPAIERRALIALYDSTNGDGWSNKSGWKTEPLDADGFAFPGTEGTWFGVTVDPGAKRVTVVSLAGNNLSGTIPPEIGDLTALQTLQLSGNRLAGSIPVEIGSLTRLYHFSLANNQLTGPIPAEIGNLSQLGFLFLFQNRLSGSIPVQLGALPHLRQMHLYTNQLTGPIPPELGNSPSLLWIVLRDNQLSGEVPPELGNLTDLQVLRLGDNQLTGEIPPELGNLVHLQSLRFKNNRMSGKIPDTLGNLTELWELLLDSNRFMGPIPASLANLTALTTTNIGYNALYASDEALIAFLAAKDSNWTETQTIAPAEVTATPVDNGVILVSWLPVAYTEDPGYYKVLISETAGGPYTAAGQTADKAASSFQVTGLTPGAPYYFVVQAHTDVHAHNANAVDSDYSAEATAVAGVPTQGEPAAGTKASIAASPMSPGQAATPVARPSITLATPNGGETWATGSTHAVAWTQTGLAGSVTIDLYKAGVYRRSLGAADATAGTFDWKLDATETAGTDYAVRIWQAGGAADDSDAAFAIVRTVKADFNGDGQEDILWRYGGAGGGIDRVWFLGARSLTSINGSRGERGKLSDPRGMAGLSETGSRALPKDRLQEAMDGSARGAGIANPVADPRRVAGTGLKAAPTARYDPRTVEPGLGAGRSPEPLDFGVADLPTVDDATWEIAACADFNNDSHTDILWRRNGPGGEVVVWLMKGTDGLGTAALPPVPDPGWRIVGTGDFNNDSQTDILWRHSGPAGTNLIWYLNGTEVIGTAELLPVTDPAWKIVGTGDFNGDGNVDVLWRYEGPGGFNVVWYLDNALISGVGETAPMADPDWEIAGTGDFDNDGNIDILWRYDGPTGHNCIWYMNGLDPVGVGTLPDVAGRSWRIVGR